MKKLLILLLPLCLCFSALAWAPERFYDTREELPQEVNAYLDAHLSADETMLTAHKNGVYLPVLTKTREDARRLFIFEETSQGFSCILESGVLPEFRGI